MKSIRMQRTARIALVSFFALPVLAGQSLGGSNPRPAPYATVYEESLVDRTAEVQEFIKDLHAARLLEPHNEELAYELAFRAELDAHPATALERLRNKGVRIELGQGPQVQFSFYDDEHLSLAIVALATLSDAVSKQDIRVAETDEKLLMGFPSDDFLTAAMFWRSAAVSIMSGERIQQAGDSGTDGKGLQMEEEALPQLRKVSVAVCNLELGCHRATKEGLAPVKPIWIVFDSLTKTPELIILDRF